MFLVTPAQALNVISKLPPCFISGKLLPKGKRKMIIVLVKIIEQQPTKKNSWILIVQFFNFRRGSSCFGLSGISDRLLLLLRVLEQVYFLAPTIVSAKRFFTDKRVLQIFTLPQGKPKMSEKLILITSPPSGATSAFLMRRPKPFPTQWPPHFFARRLPRFWFSYWHLYGKMI